MKELITCGHLQIADLGLHRNRGMELTYITRGQMEWVVEGRIEVVRQGDIFFTLPWHWHGSPVLQQPDNEAWHILFKIGGDFRHPQATFGLPPALGFSVSEARSLTALFVRARRNAWPAGKNIRNLFPWMVEAMAGKDRFSRSTGTALLRVILIELGRIVEAPASETALALDSERRVSLFLEGLKADCAEEWTLEDMARACGMQRTHFTNLVRKMTAFSPMIYLARLRIDRARELLRNPGHTVTSVAMECGFGSSQYFAQVFRKYVGLSPTQYRESFPELYKLGVDPAEISWRSLEEERARVKKFQY